MEFPSIPNVMTTLTSDFAIVVMISMSLAAMISRRYTLAASKKKPLRFAADTKRGFRQSKRDGLSGHLVVSGFQRLGGRGRTALTGSYGGSKRIKPKGSLERQWNLASKGRIPSQRELAANRIERPVDVSSVRLSIQQQFEKLADFLGGNINAAKNAERLHDLAGRQLDAVDYALINLRDELSSVITKSKIAEAALISTARGEPLRAAGQHRRLASDRGPARSRIGGYGVHGGTKRGRKDIAAA
ncbi:MAG: hypothetical protein AAFV45_15930 [Pseudomonadota bacterium]